MSDKMVDRSAIAKKNREQAKKAKDDIQMMFESHGYEILKVKKVDHERHTFLLKKDGKETPVEVYSFQSSIVSSPLLHNKQRLQELIDEQGLVVAVDITKMENCVIPAKELQGAYDRWHEPKHPIRVPAKVLNESSSLSEYFQKLNN